MIRSDVATSFLTPSIPTQQTQQGDGLLGASTKVVTPRTYQSQTHLKLVVSSIHTRDSGTYHYPSETQPLAACLPNRDERRERRRHSAPIAIITKNYCSILFWYHMQGYDSFSIVAYSSVTNVPRYNTASLPNRDERGDVAKCSDCHQDNGMSSKLLQDPILISNA